MITLSDASYVYKGKAEEVLALDEINLDIREGEFVALLGSNGSGKSTLAKLLNGLLLPTQGEVIVDGLNSQNSSHLKKIRGRVGMVFQNPENQIVATLVEEDVAFGPENLGLPTPEIRRRVDETLRLVGLENFRKKEPHFLSGGEKQKVALAGALAMRPKYLVLDEPTSHLDPKGKNEINKILRSLNEQEKMTLIYITHFTEEVTCADRVIILEEGRIKLEGSPEQALTSPAAFEAGVSPLPLTILARELEREGWPLHLDILTLEEMVESLCSLK